MSAVVFFVPGALRGPDPRVDPAGSHPRGQPSCDSMGASGFMIIDPIDFGFGIEVPSWKIF